MQKLTFYDLVYWLDLEYAKLLAKQLACLSNFSSSQQLEEPKASWFISSARDLGIPLIKFRHSVQFLVLWNDVTRLELWLKRFNVSQRQQLLTIKIEYDKSSFDLLDLALFNNSAAAVSLLIQHGFSFSRQNILSLQYALRHNHYESLKVLQSQLSADNDTLLPYALNAGYLLAAQFLMAQGFAVNGTNAKGQTPLSITLAKLAKPNEQSHAYKIILFGLIQQGARREHLTEAERSLLINFEQVFLPRLVEQSPATLWQQILMSPRQLQYSNHQLKHNSSLDYQLIFERHLNKGVIKLNLQSVEDYSKGILYLLGEATLKLLDMSMQELKNTLPENLAQRWLIELGTNFIRQLRREPCSVSAGFSNACFGLFLNYRANFSCTKKGDNQNKVFNLNIERRLAKLSSFTKLLIMQDVIVLINGYQNRPNDLSARVTSPANLKLRIAEICQDFNQADQLLQDLAHTEIANSATLSP